MAPIRHRRGEDAAVCIVNQWNSVFPMPTEGEQLSQSYINPGSNNAQPNITIRTNAVHQPLVGLESRS